MVQAIVQLERTDSPFLHSNYAIDADYFELEALPVNPMVNVSTS